MKKQNKKKKIDTFEDDGRVIAPMNVDGMPWYTPKRSQTSDQEQPPLDKKETRSFMFSALLAALLVSAVFIIAAALLILFATKIWLK
ncbi:MAG: hypothetical protein WC292_05465 [Clostridia bacterium]